MGLVTVATDWLNDFMLDTIFLLVVLSCVVYDLATLLTSTEPPGRTVLPGWWWTCQSSA